MGRPTPLETDGAVTLATSFSTTGEEPDELVRRRLRGFSSSSEQLTPGIGERERARARARAKGGSEIERRRVGEREEKEKVGGRNRTHEQN